MPYNVLTVVGVGLVGGSVGLAAKARGLTRRVVGVGRREASLKEAAAAGAVDETTLDLREGVSGADLVVLAAPVDRIADLGEEAVPAMKRGALATDVGSTKARIVERLDSAAAGRVRYLGGHPMAGSEKRGPANARADLFEGATTILTPTAATDESALDELTDFWTTLGSRVVTLPPEAHDAAIAEVSHLPHLAASALMASLHGHFLYLAGRGLADATRIAAGDADLWSAIVAENWGPVEGALDAYRRTLDEIGAAVKARDRGAVKNILDRARAARGELETEGPSVG